MLDAIDDAGVYDDLEQELVARGREGVWFSGRLPLADRFADGGVPSGICPLNAEDAYRIALDVYDLSDHVNVVIGRDSVATRRSDSESLLATPEYVTVDPNSAVFIGDSAHDEVTTDRAGVALRYVDGGPTGV